MSPKEKPRYLVGKCPHCDGNVVVDVVSYNYSPYGAESVFQKLKCSLVKKETDHAMRCPHCRKNVYLKPLRPDDIEEEVLQESEFKLIKDPDRKRIQKLCPGILVPMDKATLKEKQEQGRKSDGRWCYWSLPSFPKRFEKHDGEFPLYMAIDDKVRGYFMAHEWFIDLDEGTNDLLFYSEALHPIKGGEEVKAFKGWRYYPKR